MYAYQDKWTKNVDGMTGWQKLLVWCADADRHLKNMLFWDVNNGIFRCSWALN